MDFENNGLVSDIKKIMDYKKVDEEIIYQNYDNYTLKGIIEKSKLSEAFLSSENIDIIQESIRHGVYQKIGKIISKQSNEEVFTIMRSIYLQEGGKRIRDRSDLMKEIHSLNKKVIDYSVDFISSKLKQYDMYLNDISTLPVPLERPIYDNKRKNTTYDISNLF